MQIDAVGRNKDIKENQKQVCKYFDIFYFLPLSTYFNIFVGG